MNLEYVLLFNQMISHTSGNTYGSTVCGSGVSLILHGSIRISSVWIWYACHRAWIHGSAVYKSGMTVMHGSTDQQCMDLV